jgi:hypothetical protein
VVGIELTWRLEEFRGIVNEYFPVTDLWFDDGRPAFVVQVTPDSHQRFLRLRQRLEPLGYLPLLRRRDGKVLINFVPRPAPGAWRWEINALMFVLTLVTTSWAGYFQAAGLAERGYLSNAWGGALAFSLSLMLILGTHEAGHKVVSIVRRIDASLPYFIPMLPPVGTMGAVIITRTPAPNRDSLMDLGASGPIAGFVVAVIVVIVGLTQSFALSPEAVRGEIFLNYPDPLLIQWLSHWLLDLPPGALLLSHPILSAGWIGLLVTSINLLPASMLDGGHAIRALAGARAHRIVSWTAVAVAVALRYWAMATLLAAIMLVFRREHPGPMDDVSPIHPSRMMLGLVLLAIFIVSAVPIEITLVRP